MAVAVGGDVPGEVKMHVASVRAAERKGGRRRGDARVSSQGADGRTEQ